jgi:hypothetical protein
MQAQNPAVCISMPRRLLLSSFNTLSQAVLPLWVLREVFEAREAANTANK